MYNKIFGWESKDIKSLFTFVASNSEQAVIKSLSVWALQHNKRPYSVRNFFYKILKLANDDKDVYTKLLDIGIDTKNFFNKAKKIEDTKILLSKILDYRKKQSVWNVCLELANNNVDLAQKLQNKYRNTIACHPNIVQQVITSLQNEGIPTRITFAQKNIVSMPKQPTSTISERDLQSLVFGVINLIRRTTESNLNQKNQQEWQQINNHLQKALIDNRRKDVLLSELMAENQKIRETLRNTQDLQQKQQAERDATYLTIKDLVNSKKQKALQNFVSNLLIKSQENTTI